VPETWLKISNAATGSAIGLPFAATISCVIV
jgi:hypothetical protein